jgi:pimeloyl-ACP methyl ester carboxylesterase
MMLDDAWRAEYPFDSHTLDLDGHDYHYVDEGRGTPVLLVHGNPTWSFYWRHVVRDLRAAHRVVAVDHVGCGLSAKPQRYDYCLRTHIANLRRLVEHLDLRNISLVVHDWGGPIGVGAALEFPERVQRLVLLNTGLFPPPFVPFRIAACRFPLVGNWLMRGANAFARAALHMATSRPERFTPVVRSGYLAPYDSWEHRVGIARFVQDIPFTRHHRTWETLDTLERNLPRLVHCPVCIVWGLDDWCFTDVCLQRLLQHFPHADVHRLEHVGHYVAEDAAEKVVEVVRAFLAHGQGIMPSD